MRVACRPRCRPRRVASLVDEGRAVVRRQDATQAHAWTTSDLAGVHLEYASAWEESIARVESGWLLVTPSGAVADGGPVRARVRAPVGCRNCERWAAACRTAGNNSSTRGLVESSTAPRSPISITSPGRRYRSITVLTPRSSSPSSSGQGMAHVRSRSPTAATPRKGWPVPRSGDQSRGGCLDRGSNLAKLRGRPESPGSSSQQDRSSASCC
jgi:hypothetical protein